MNTKRLYARMYGCNGDGIPDVVEVMLSNASHFLDFYNFTHNEKNNATGLWNDYAWSIAYYFSIKLHEEWDEVYHNLESNPVYWIERYNLAEAHNESTGENASKYLSTQYNPLVVENTPPVVVKFTVKWRIVVSLNPPGTSVYANVTVLVRDVGGVAYLRVLDENSGDSVILRNVGPSVKVEHNFSASLWQAGFGSVHVHVVAKDYAGNYIVVRKELKGAFGQMLDALAELWQGFMAVLHSVGEKIASGLQWIVGWIVNIANDAISKIFTPLWEAIDKWISDITKYMEEIEAYYDEYLSSGDKNSLYNMFDTMAKLFSITLVPIFSVISMIMLGLNIVMFTITALTGGATEILSSVLFLIIPLIMSAFGASGNEYVQKLSVDEVGISLLNYVFDSIFSPSESSKYARKVQKSSTSEDLSVILPMLSLLLSLAGWADAEARLSWYANTYYKEIYKEFKYWKTGINKGKVLESCRNDIQSAKTSIVLSAIGFFLAIIQGSLKGVAKMVCTVASFVVGLRGVFLILHGFVSITSNKLLVLISFIIGLAGVGITVYQLIGGGTN